MSKEYMGRFPDFLSDDLRRCHLADGTEIIHPDPPPDLAALGRWRQRARQEARVSGALAGLLDEHHSLGAAELFLAWLFYGKVRKFSGLAATSHPVHVARLVTEPGARDLRGLAHTLFMAILHDIPEDAGALGLSLSPAQVVQSLWKPSPGNPWSLQTDKDIAPDMIAVLDTLTDHSGLKGHARLFAQMEKVLNLHERDPVLGLVAFLLRCCDKLSSYGTDAWVVESDRWPMDPGTDEGRGRINAYRDDMSIRAGILEEGWEVIKGRYVHDGTRYCQEASLSFQIEALMKRSHGVLENLRTDLDIMLCEARAEGSASAAYDWREVYVVSRRGTIGSLREHPLNRSPWIGAGLGHGYPATYSL